MTLQQACIFIFENDHRLTVLTEGEKKEFLKSLNKVLVAAYDEEDKTLDQINSELDKS